MASHHRMVICFLDLDMPDDFCRTVSENLFPSWVAKTHFWFFITLKYLRILLRMLRTRLCFLAHSLSCQYTTLSAFLNVSLAAQFR